MQLQQCTVAKSVTFSGVGVHSGKQSSVRVMPAKANTGIVFRHKELPGQPIKIGSIVPEEAMHATVLRSGRLVISTVEHLMAALHALGIDNVEIEVDSCEVPILDGSALSFLQMLMEIDVQCYQDAKKFITPCQAIELKDEESGRSLTIEPAQNEKFSLDISYQADFAHPLVGRQQLQGVLSPDFFLNEVAAARTFGFLDQLPFLRKHGLAQGTSLGNTVVVGPEGYMNELRFTDEFVRHKFLDLVGDLYLMGHQLIGKVSAYKTGHSFNRLVVKSMLEDPHLWKLVAGF